MPDEKMSAKSKPENIAAYTSGAADPEMIRNFERHGFTVKHFNTGAEAREYLVEALQGRTIGFGGSITLRQIGLYDALAKNNAVIWHHHAASEEVRRLATAAKVYITSANAVSRTGEIVNIDGAGNRLAASIYGPDQVYFVVGRNKITEDLPAALDRAKNVAAPLNAKRFNLKTPCAAKADRCYDCNNKERICRCTLIIERAPNRLNSEIIFIDEDLGY